jgi:hypothetical protein
MHGQSDQDLPPPLPPKSGKAQTSSRGFPDTKSPKKPGLLRRWFWAPVASGENWAQTIFRVLGNLFRIALTACVVLFVFGASVMAFSFAKENRPEWFGSSNLTEWCDDQYEYEYYKHERSEKICSERWTELNAAKEAALAAKPENNVVVTVEPANFESGSDNIARGCSSDYPFAIRVRNNSDMAMTDTWIDVSFRIRGTTSVGKFRGHRNDGGRSDSWRDGYDKEIIWFEKIILPNSTAGKCIKLLPEDILDFDPQESYVFKAELGEYTDFVEAEHWMYEELGKAK